MSQAINGIGAKFYRWNGSAWDEYAEVTSITPPNPTRDTDEVTHLNSPDEYKEYIGGMRDGGTMTVAMNFIKANYIKIRDDFENDDLQYYEIVLNDTEKTTFEVEGLITEMPIADITTAKITCNITIKINGKPILTEGGSSTPA